MRKPSEAVPIQYKMKTEDLQREIIENANSGI